MQDPAPVQRCVTELKTGPQGWKEGKCDEDRDEGGGEEENEDGDGEGDEDRDWGGDGDGDGDGDREENGEWSEREREPGSLRSDSEGRVEGVREGATPTGNQQRQPRDPIPQ